MRTLLVRVGLLFAALLCFIAPASADSISTYPALGFGPTPSGGTFTFTPGIGNVAIVSNVPVMQIGASITGFPLTTSSA